jgi:hypothetical protein
LAARSRLLVESDVRHPPVTAADREKYAAVAVGD